MINDTKDIIKTVPEILSYLSSQLTEYPINGDSMIRIQEHAKSFFGIPVQRRVRQQVRELFRKLVQKLVPLRDGFVRFLSKLVPGMTLSQVLSPARLHQTPGLFRSDD